VAAGKNLQLVQNLNVDFGSERCKLVEKVIMISK
jgi:hypothetical protein